jgi:prepilin-type N-terminal cleavage/methylation domain-containing protein
MNKGFTLLEALISIAMLGIFMVAVSATTLNIVQSNQKLITVDEVQYNTRFASEKMIRSVRNSAQIDLQNTVFESNPGVLQLNMDETSEQPTIFNVSEGRMYMKRGSENAIPITSEKVDITNFQIKNRTPDEKQASIVIILTISHKNPSGSNMYQYEETIEFAATNRRK